jgi:polar amino acid transport system substrate-binding protein
VLLGLVAAAALIAGCGTSSDRALKASLAALAAKAPASKSSSSVEPTVACKNPTASLRPSGALPTPGSMPAGTTMAQIQKRGHLIAGVDQNTLLFAYFNPVDGTLEGAEIDLLHELARAIFGDPNKIVFKAITTNQRISAVQDGTVDVVADAFTIDCYRDTKVDFSTVYYDAGQRLLVPVGSPIKGLQDLAGKRVCATKGSTSLANLKRLAPAAIPVERAQRTDCLVALQQGAVDAVTSDDAILLGFAAQDPYTRIVGPRFSAEPYGIAVNKSQPDLVQFVNGVLAKMRADGSWRAIFQHWLGPFEHVPPPPAPLYG